MGTAEVLDKKGSGVCLMGPIVPVALRVGKVGYLESIFHQTPLQYDYEGARS